MRLDVEPRWEGNPQTVVFRARYNGIALCPFNIRMVLTRLQMRWAPWSCHTPTLELAVKADEKWNKLTIEHFIRTKT